MLVTCNNVLTLSFSQFKVNIKEKVHITFLYEKLKLLYFLSENINCKLAKCTSSCRSFHWFEAPLAGCRSQSGGLVFDIHVLVSVSVQNWLQSPDPPRLKTRSSDHSPLDSLLLFYSRLINDFVEKNCCHQPSLSYSIVHVEERLAVFFWEFTEVVVEALYVIDQFGRASIV